MTIRAEVQFLSQDVLVLPRRASGKRLSAIIEGSEATCESEETEKVCTHLVRVAPHSHRILKVPDVGTTVGDFHFVHRIRAGVCETGKVYLGRRKDDTLLYAVKAVEKYSSDSKFYADSRTRMRTEQAALKIITERGLCTFVPKLWHSFEDTQMLYLITVMLLQISAPRRMLTSMQHAECVSRSELTRTRRKAWTGRSGYWSSAVLRSRDGKASLQSTR